MSLLSWIWDGIRAKIEALFHALIEPVKRWVRGLVQAARAFAEDLVTGVTEALDNARKILGDKITVLKGSLDTFTTKTLPDLQASISNGLKTLAAKITPLSTSLENLRSKTLPDLWTGLSNVRKDLVQKIRQSIDDTRSWVATQITGVKAYVDHQFAVLIPAGFIRDPHGYMHAAFNSFIDPWVQGILRSFQEGFEEGLKTAEEELERG